MMFLAAAIVALSVADGLRDALEATHRRDVCELECSVDGADASLLQLRSVPGRSAGAESFAVFPAGKGAGCSEWTKAESGAKCYFDEARTDCAVCAAGGCQCWDGLHTRCVKCGAGEACAEAQTLQVCEDEAFCHKDGALLWWYEAGDGGTHPRGVRCSTDADPQCRALTDAAEAACDLGSVVETVTCERKGPYLPERPARFDDAGGASSFIIDQRIWSPPMEPYFEFEQHQLLCSTFTYSDEETFISFEMKETPTPRPTPVPEVYCNKMIDIVVVVDSSGSLKLSGFEDAIAFVQKIILHSTVGARDVRYGIVQYSSPGKYPQATAAGVVVKPLSADQDDLLTAVRGMEYTGGSTHTGEAMELAAGVLEGGKRKEAASAVLVVTDGEATDWHKLKTAAKKVKDGGSLVMMAVVSPPGNDLLQTQAMAYSFSEIVSKPAADHLHVEGSYALLVANTRHYADRICNPRTIPSGNDDTQEPASEDDWGDDW